MYSKEGCDFTKQKLWDDDEIYNRVCNSNVSVQLQLETKWKRFQILIVLKKKKMFYF